MRLTLLRLPAAIFVTTLAACGGGGGQEADAGPKGPALAVLSNRADLVSGGDVLVAVPLPSGVNTGAVAFTVNGAAAQVESGVRDGVLMARVSGLALGANDVVARVNGSTSSATVVNHPNGGPVFFGPRIEPWHCQDGAVDADCNQPVQYSYLYKSTDGSKDGLQPYDPANPPSDVASTTTDQGIEVPFIVRQELGYQDRDQYKVLTLFRPDQAWAPWAPQDQWNHKVLITHGGGCGTDHGPGGAPLDDFSGTIPSNPATTQSYVKALGLGFAVLSTALDNLGHNCNVVLAAESLVMAKERFVEQYGPIRYTIGTGCSGGSITQMMVSNAYPGVYQGNITTCAYPDVFSTGAQFADLHMLRGYFEDPSKWGAGVVWTPEQMAAVEGNVSHLNAITTDELFFKSVTNPEGDCAGDDSYDADANPGGVRCGLMDFLVNILGTRAPAAWSPMETAAGKGFAGNPIDNRGVQYGLAALQQGVITPAQFVDLNSKIGGLSIDILPQAERTLGDSPAVANAYRSGELNNANNLDRVAIINVSGPDPGAAHDTVHGWWTRWRLEREHGNHDNHVMWIGPVALAGDVEGMNNALAAMDAWLAQVEADTSPDPLVAKLTRARVAAGVHDNCYDGNGNGLPAGGEECVANAAPLTYFSSPRAVAGGPRTDDIIKCQLKPFSRDDDYGLVPLMEADWAQLESLFAGGVCDYSQPGDSQQGAVAWQTYFNDAGGVVYGGRPLPPAPANSGLGWASPAFAVFR